MRGSDREADDRAARAAAALVALQAEQGHELVLRVEGRSMGALLAFGRQVLVRPPGNRARLGDVVLFRRGPELVAHRVIGRRGAAQLQYLTKGDGCFEADEPVAAEDLLGVVCGIQEGERLLVPWHWRRPFSPVVAWLSRLEALAWPHFNYPLRAFHRKWRWAWRPREQESEENLDDRQSDAS